jgi:cyclohexyl-isocyanide hydratase
MTATSTADTTAERSAYKVSVCTGALVWGAAGFLRGRRATTHHDAAGLLAQYGATYADERVVEDGGVITAGGVSAALDLGLYLVDKLAGADARDRIRAQMAYRG